MDLSELSKRIVRDLDEAISADLPAAERDAISKIVREAILEANKQTHAVNKKAATAACGPDADLAHKIQESLDRERDMLIVNLSSAR